MPASFAKAAQKPSWVMKRARYPAAAVGRSWAGTKWERAARGVALRLYAVVEVGRIADRGDDYLREIPPRSTRTAGVVNRREYLSPRRAPASHLSPMESPGATPSRVRPGAPADLVLPRAPMPEVLRRLDADLVRLTVIGGRPQAESATL
jgi:hypothetical protein